MTANAYRTYDIIMGGEYYPRTIPMWEVEWSRPGTTGNRAWARNSTSHIKKSREWHWVSTASLRRVGVSTPTYRADSWEVDWTLRNGKLVWARNLMSKMPKARNWHWIDFHTIERAGGKWQPKRERTGRLVTDKGYVRLSRVALTEADVQLAEEHGLWKGGKPMGSGSYLQEHQLVAVKKYGRIPPGHVVRHINGVKADNRPENLVLGTIAENNMDHTTARVMAMYWREQYETLRQALEPIAGGWISRAEAEEIVFSMMSPPDGKEG